MSKISFFKKIKNSRHRRHRRHQISNLVDYG